MGKFDNKIVIVTGGSRGIGKTIAEQFAENGAKVIITYKNSVDAAHFDTLGIVHKQCDSVDTKSVTELIEGIVKEFGKVDILINNAGLTKDGLLMRMTEDDWDVVMDTNAKGLFNFTKAVTRSMMSQRKGKIVNISSIVGIIGNAGQANYAASKAAVIGFTKSVAKELGSRNICVNCVAPGFIETDMTDKLNEIIKKSFIDSVPLKRFGKTMEVANLVMFLSSEESDYITGQVIAVDGGMVM